MKDFEELKSIWSSQARVPRIGYDDIKKRLHKSKKNFANKLLLETAGMLAGILIFIAIWVSSPFQMWTTHLALLIFIACCLYYVIVQFRDYKKINNSEWLLKQPEEYIRYIKDYRRKRYILNTRNYGIYSIFIGIAFSLYFIEIYFTAPLWQTLTGILFTAGWYFICWRLMRLYIKREQEKLYEMINNLERLQNQFKD